MLGRKLTGSASFVCLRCRQLLVRAPQRPPPPALVFAPARVARRYIANRAGLRSSDEPNDDRIDWDANAELDLETHAERTGGRAGHAQGTAPYWPPSAPSLPQQRIYKSRGHVFTPEPEGLAVDILGKPGSAIVLREQRSLARKRQAFALEFDDSGDAPVSAASLLPDKDTEVASDDILVNIHELKPKETRILTDKQFRKLKRTLVDGFTTSQLSSYIRAHQQTRQFNQDEQTGLETTSLDEYPWILESRPWVPAVQKAAQDVEPRLEGYITRGMVPKERLAVRIIRECWDVSNQKILDQDGYLSLQLREVEFTLLTRGHRRWLEGMPRAVLAQVKQVKMIRETRSVSVVAPRPTTDAILERINRVLSSTRSSEFPVDVVSPQPLKPDVLEEIGRVTNTVVRFDPSGKKVVVTWIHMAQRDEVLENAAETVMRLLRDAYGKKPRVSSAVQVVLTDLAQPGRYVDMLDYTQKLPWQERSEKWERWASGLPRRGAGVGKVSIPSEIIAYPLQTQPALKESESEGPADTPSGWSSELQTHTSAVFGHVAFARQKQPSTPASSPEPPSQLDTSLARTFLPAVPALGSLNLATNLREEGIWHSTVVIRFAPSPDIGPELIAAAPDLELRIEADHRELKRLVSLHAIKDEFIGDVLFPTAAVDTRVVQQRYFTLPGAGIEQHVPQLLTYISKSDLRPWDGKLGTPPVLLGVRLPHRLISPSNAPVTSPADTDADITSSDNAEAGDDSVQIDYSLASVEVRRTVTAAYMGLKLRYTRIQAGPRGGEWSELALDAVRVTHTGGGYTAPIPRGEHSDRYEFVEDDSGDGTESGPQLQGSHVMNAGDDKVAEPAVSAKRVGRKDFIRVASAIVNEQGGLKWHVKRS